MPLALSTSWNACRHTDSRGMLFEISQLKFSNIELSFNLTRKMLDELPEAMLDFGIKVTSLHNYCPIPETFERKYALPDCYSLSSLDPQERALAIKYTKRTIDTASSLRASFVVLHCGRVEIEDKTRPLISLYASGKKDSCEFKALKNIFIQERDKAAAPFLESILLSLDELSQYARDQGVSLGIENRFYYREIPSFDEIGLILDRFKGRGLFYWHDTGHARIMQNLGFIENKDYLTSYGKRLGGLHLHSAIGCLDHQPLQKGDLDLSVIKKYLNRDTLKVIEVHQPANAEDIRKSKELLEERLSGVIQGT